MARILAVSGSLRQASHNTALLRAVAANAPDGIAVELYDELEQLPPFNEDRESDPGPVVEAMRRRVRDADALLFSTPEYNTTMPGQLKHLVDWGSRPYGPEAALYGKPAAVIGASTTPYGALWAQDHLRKALALAGARVTEAELSVGQAQQKFNDGGELVDQETIDKLERVVAELVEHHQLLSTGP